MDDNKQLSEGSSNHNFTCRYPTKESGIFDTQNQYHAVSLSGGKDNEKRYKMKSYLQKD